MKFTFKTEKRAGRYSSFFRPLHLIKLNKCEVGTINDKFPHKIRLMVVKKNIEEDGNSNCIWKWITLKKESSSVEEAKKFLNEVFNKISIEYNIYKSEL